jgi:hypothetical protein
VTEEQIGERKTWLAKKWDVPVDLEGDCRNLFRPGYCFVCNANFLAPAEAAGMGAKTAANRLNKHLKQCHSRIGCTRAGRELQRRVRSELLSWKLGTVSQVKFGKCVVSGAGGRALKNQQASLRSYGLKKKKRRVQKKK